MNSNCRLLSSWACPCDLVSVTLHQRLLSTLLAVAQVSGAAEPDAPVQMLLPQVPRDRYEGNARLEQLIKRLEERMIVQGRVVMCSTSRSATVNLMVTGMIEPLAVTFVAATQKEADEKVKQTDCVMQQVGLFFGFCAIIVCKCPQQAVWQQDHTVP